jgi:hypothetical protein
VPEPEKNESVDLPVPSGPPVIQQAKEEVPNTAIEGEPRWESATGDGGTGIRFVGNDGAAALSIFCPEAGRRLVVSVPSFKPIGSEDRFVLALGQEPVTLVADPTRQKSGVTAEGAAPENLKALLEKAETIGAHYGNQQIGPHPTPAQVLLEALTKECRA